MAEIWTMGELLCEIMRPEAGSQLFEKGAFLGPFPSGAPAIFADTVAKMAHSVGIIGGVGKDDFGKCILKKLSNDGVNVKYVQQYEAGSTGVAFVTYFEDGSRKFIYHFSNTPATMAKAPNQETDFTDIKFFHIMGCSLMADFSFGREIIKMMRIAKRNGAKISFDPNIRTELLQHKECYELVNEVVQECNILEPGVAELMAITEQDTLENAIKKSFENENLELLAIKNGSKGSTIYTRNDACSFGVFPVDVKDSTGAGDCFDAALLCSILEGKSLEETAQMASAVAALNTAAFGPMEGIISPEAVKQIIETHKTV